LYTIQAFALGIVLVGRHFRIVANEPWWAYASAIVGSSLISRRLDRWSSAPRGSWRLHVRVCMHAVTVLAVIYLTGWGPALGLCFVYAALVDLQQSGPSSWRAVLGWSLVCCAGGQLSVLQGWMPSFLGRTDAQSLGFLGAVAFSIVIIMAGAIGEAKQRSDDLLDRARDEALSREAQYRAVVENAAEGILTFGLDGSVLSFNRAAQAIFGWSEAEIVGRAASALVPAELHDALGHFLATCKEAGTAAGQSSDIEITGVRRDGMEFPMVVSTSAITGEANSVFISGVVRDLSDQKKLEAQLTFQAMHDSLTGLANRMMLTDRLDQTLARVRRHGSMCGVFYVDLDRFKAVNDTLGHSVGDQLLTEAAGRIKAAVRELDTVARLGGDEFVVLCEDIEGIHHATEVAERIIGVFQSPFRLGGDDPSLSASIGIALSTDGAETAEAILANADIAMYRAKNNGRNCFQLFDQTMQDWVIEQASLEAALRQAVPRGELVLYGQPFVEAATGLIEGFEVLVRWERPGFGLLGPYSFIPAAEETGLIHEIGSWVLDQACLHAATWAERWPDRRFAVAVNISGRQLVAGDMVEIVSDALTRTRLDPALLTLELTESTLIDDAVTVEPILRALRDLGVVLALDDFGTGYSSLSYLRAFPFNIVKIDQSFIRMIGTRREDAAIVAAVIGLAKNLGLDVVAEGVETHDQLAALRELGCHHLQGYLFARPQPILLATDLLETPTLGFATIE
jgi:diguanylate cyclase (GGDEF)-like protein/PAS domain S-box-containing protein